MKNQIVLALMLALSLPQAGQAADGRALLQVNLLIPPGESRYSFAITPPQRIDPFQVIFTYSSSCVFGYLSPDVKYEGDADWKEATKNGAIFNTEERNVVGLQFRLSSPQTYDQSCEITVVTPTETPTPVPQPDPGENQPPSGEWREAGVLNYPGGDFTLVGVELNATYYGQKLVARVPEDCSGVSLSELGIIRSGSYVKAKPVAGKDGEFELDQLSTFNQVRVSISGPQNMFCPLRIFIYDESSTLSPQTSAQKKPSFSRTFSDRSALFFQLRKDRQTFSSQ